MFVVVFVLLNMTAGTDCVVLERGGGWSNTGATQVFFFNSCRLLERDRFRLRVLHDFMMVAGGLVLIISAGKKVLVIYVDAVGLFTLIFVVFVLDLER